MMRKFTRLNDKINKKGFNFDSKRRMFRQMDVKNKICYNYGEKDHISPDCPKPDKRKKDNKSKHRHDSSDYDDEDEKKNKNKKFGKKKSHDKKTKLFPKKKGNTKRSFLVEKQE